MRKLLLALRLGFQRLLQLALAGRLLLSPTCRTRCQANGRRKRAGMC